MKETGLSIVFKRPLATFCLALITGILAACLAGSALFVIGLLFLISAVLYALNGKLRGRVYISLGIIFFYALGAFEYLLLDGLNSGRFAEFGSEAVTVNGFVDSEPEIKESRVSYIIRVKELKAPDGRKAAGGRLLLSMLKADGMKLYEYGSELTFTGRLALPQGVRNPGGFDYRRYMAQRGVSATVFVSAESISRGAGEKGSFIIKAGHAIKDRIVSVIDRSLPRQQAGLLNGMLIGYREGLSREVTDAFCDAGLTHIMAVSGANIVFLIIPLAFIFKRLRLGNRTSGLLTMAFLFVFIFITGFEPSVLRAVVMASVMLTARMLNRETDVYTTIAFAAMLLLLCSPCMLFNVGFQLSFAATLSLVMLYGNIKKLIVRSRFIPQAIASILAATLAAQLGVLPITLACFNRVSLVAVLSNLIAAPLLEFITIIGMFMAVLGQISIVFSQLLGYINCVFLSIILYITKISSSVPFASIRTVTPPTAGIVLYYIALWFLLWYRPLKNIRIKPRYIAAALVLSAVPALVIPMVPGKLEVVFLDVGQGDSAFIRTCTGKNVLLDGGGSTDPNAMSKVGESVIAPFLLDKGVTALDAVIASHGHSDHTQGLLTAMEQFRVDSLIIPLTADDEGFEKLLELAGSKRIKVERCERGDVIKLDRETSLDVLSPSPELETAETSLNNTSLVLKLHYGDADVLFTGDAEAEAEQQLLEGGADLAAEVLKIGHHGSSTSTGRTFLEKVDPVAAVISVGRNNFGHPSPVTLDLLRDEGVRVFRTDECGAVVLTSRGGDIRLKGTVGP
jgi:competence protein ComEC